MSDTPEDGDEAVDPDDHEHHDHPSGQAMHLLIPGGFGMMPTPEQLEQHRMAAQANQHDLYRLFTELPEDQLQQVNHLLHVVNSHSENNALGEYFEGIVVGVLYGKYNICLSCGVDHDKEIQNMMAADAEATKGEGDDGGA